MLSSTRKLGTPISPPAGDVVPRSPNSDSTVGALDTSTVGSRSVGTPTVPPPALARAVFADIGAPTTPSWPARSVVAAGHRRLRIGGRRPDGGGGGDDRPPAHPDHRPAPSCSTGRAARTATGRARRAAVGHRAHDPRTGARRRGDLPRLHGRSTGAVVGGGELHPDHRVRSRGSHDGVCGAVHVDRRDPGDWTRERPDPPSATVRTAATESFVLLAAKAHSVAVMPEAPPAPLVSPRPTGLTSPSGPGRPWSPELGPPSSAADWSCQVVSVPRERQPKTWHSLLAGGEDSHA